MSRNKALFGGWFALLLAAGAIGCGGDRDRDGDGHLASVDCNDDDAEVHPGAVELCDEVDNDCDGAVDADDLDLQSELVRYRDFDLDGSGDASSPFAACSDADGGSSTADDCDDRSDQRAPGKAEICDGLDNDCDGLTDDADPSVDPATFTLYHRDLDLDGFGDPFGTFPSCSGGFGRTLDASDCDDGDPLVFPGSQEVCDARDNDCDGLTDDFDPSVDVTVGGVPVYVDNDGDGHGNPDQFQIQCAAPPNRSLLGDDCNDNRIHTNPEHPEVCDGQDNDCNGLVDDADPGVDTEMGADYYMDADGDGFGDPAFGSHRCSGPPNSVPNNLDCDDTNALLHPGQVERCDGLDNDCDGLPDSYDDGLVDGDVYYVDSDFDGFGDANQATRACSPIPGKTQVIGDCNDRSSTAYPGASEVCDQDDNDCDGLVDDDDPDRDVATTRTFWFDGDYDGAGVDGTEVQLCTMPWGFAPVGGDCDDADDLNSPIGREDCDGKDNDCDGLVDDSDPDVYVVEALFHDADGDGFGDPNAPYASCSPPGADYVQNFLDCDDTDPDVLPGDADGDGYDACVDEHLDCDDADPNIHPFAGEPCNGVDDDCDGHPDNLTGEGDTAALGCDLCPSIDGYDPALVAYETYNPCVLDPNVVNLCSDNPYYPDTHTQGNRLHKVSYRTDISVYRDKLFLFFPPGKGLNNKNITKWAAYVGYKVINLGFDNELKFSIACEDYDGDCGTLLEETHLGNDVSSLVTIGPADSITGRLQTLLAFLDYTYPTMGWGTHLNADGTVNWSTIVVTGWSNGSGAAGYATRDVEAGGSILFSGPQDWIAPGVLHPWLTDFQWQTPASTMFGVYHIYESDIPLDLFEMPWREMGMEGDRTDMVETPFPWNDSHVLTTTAFHMGADHCTAHKAIAFDQCMDVALLGQPYLDLFCEAGDAQ